MNLMDGEAKLAMALVLVLAAVGYGVLYGLHWLYLKFKNWRKK